jgi:hypothetical protein
MRGTRRFATLATLVVFSALATINRVSAADGLLYAVNTSCDCLYTVHADGTKTVIGPLAQDPGESFVVPRAMAMDLDGTIYVQDGIASQLLTVDPLTGDATPVGSIPIVEALAINGTDVPRSQGGTWPAGTLFAVAGIPPSGQGGLVVLDKTSGAILETIGPIGPRIASLSFRSDGVLFGTEVRLPEEGPPRLFRVSTINAILTEVGGIGPGFSLLGATAFDPSGGFWVSDTDNLKLFRVNEDSAATLCAIPLTPSQAFDDPSAPQGMAFAPDMGAFPPDCSQDLAALSPAKVWIGLKNSDDVGTTFDLRAEVLKNGTLIGSGQLNNISGGSSGFNNAKLREIPLTLSAPVRVASDDTLSLKLSVRNTCFGKTHNAGTARLWFNDSQADSHFDMTIGDTTSDLFLLDGFVLSTDPGSGPKKTIDVVVDSKVSCPTRPFKAFGTWNIALP